MFCNTLNPRYQEILKLDRMLTEENIPHTLDRRFDGWQICYPSRDQNCVMDAIQHFGSYGNKSDKLEIAGLLTPNEEECDSVLGDLTAEDVFKRINKHYKGEWEQFTGSLSVEDDTEAPWLDDSISREYPMSPKEFAKKMTDISDKLRHPPENDPYYDEERCHAEMDDLMSDLLVALGYGEGIEIFNNTDKWYS